MKQQRRGHLTGVYKSHFSQKNKTKQKNKSSQTAQNSCWVVNAEHSNVFVQRGTFHCGVHFSILLLLPLFSCFFFVFISLLRLFSFTVGKEVKDFKAQPFLKMHVVSGFSRLRDKKNVTFFFLLLLLFETKLRRKKISQKVPVKGLPPSLYENLLFSRDCAMFFNIGYFI